VLDDAGRPLSLAHARVLDATGKILEQVEIGKDGRFTVPRGKVQGAIAWLELSGVDHRESTVLVAVEKEPVEVNVRLGTYPAPAPLGDIRLVLWDGNKATARLPMTQRPDGTYLAEVSTRADKLRYQIDGVANGRTVNGTMAKAYEYDGGGDYLSVVPVTNGKVRVVFDPSERPPPGVDTRVDFADPKGTSAQLTDISRRLAAAQEESTRTMRAAIPKGPAAIEQAMNALSFDGFRRELAAFARSDDPLVRHAALVAYFTPGAFTAKTEDDRALARAAIAEIKPTDPIWALGESAVIHVFDVVDAWKTSADYVAAFIDGQPATAPVAGCLFRKLVRGAAEEKAAAYRRLKSERFAVTQYGRMAERFNPDRPNAAGKPLPEFAVSALDGKGTFSPAKLLGKVYLIEVWATWCAPCVAGMPALHEAYKKYGKTGKRKLHILSISLDESPEAVTKFRKGTWPMPWDHAFPTADEKRALHARFGAAIPFYALVSEQGKILAASPELEADKLGEVLDRLEQ
jgi:thiol-disulfide isomerase/thioredoxin